MIIFTIIWWVIKIWFVFWMLAGTVLGCVFALGLGIALVLFGWECAVDWIKKKWK